MNYVSEGRAPLPVSSTGGASVAGNLSSGSSGDNQPICQVLDRTLDRLLESRRLRSDTHAAWQVMHGVMAFGRGFPLEVQGRTTAALDYLLAGGTLEGWQWEPGDAVDPHTGRPGWRAILLPGSRTGQGHPDQWLGYLATCGIRLDETIRYGDAVFTLEDVVRQVEWDVGRNITGEYSWTLMGLSAYRPSHHRWRAADGQIWSFERLIEVELGRERDTSACGGTHRLYGLAMALNRHLAQGGMLFGAWQRADGEIQEAILLAREYQNADGSFSSHYFARPGVSADLSLDLSATGHVFEFLAVACDNRQLHEPWVERAARHLCRLIDQARSVPLDCGALYHAAHGLVLYRQRLCGPRNWVAPRDTAHSAADGGQDAEPR